MTLKARTEDEEAVSWQDIKSAIKTFCKYGSRWCIQYWTLAMDVFVVGVFIFFIWLEHVLLYPSVLTHFEIVRPQLSSFYDFIMWTFPVVQWALAVAGTASLAMLLLRYLSSLDAGSIDIEHKDADYLEEYINGGNTT